MRIVSLLPGGTELLCALGQGDALVGRSHECDEPAWVTRLPVLSGPTFDVSGSSAEIDRLVRERLKASLPLYEIRHQPLRALAPDLVLTQSHCDVCAVGPTALAAAHAWPGLEDVRTVAMHGGSLDGILRDVVAVAEAAGCPAEGQALAARLDADREQWRARTSPLARPRVVCLEWTDPPFPMGNWGPELVELAGGRCVLGNAGAHSEAVPWQSVLDADPDVLIVAPCGYGLQRAMFDAAALTERPGWARLRAVRAGRVYVADGNRYFNRTGASAFASVAVLAEMIHPEVFRPQHEGAVFRRWS